MNSSVDESDQGVRRGVRASLLSGRTTRAPLSFAQERLWFVEKLGLVGATYTIPLALRLSGSLDVAGLEKSLEQLLMRHESLRTRIESVDGQGVQVIDAPGGFVLEKIELRELTAAPEQTAEESLERWVQQESSRAFEITGGVLFRGLLLQVDVEDHVLLLCMHHIISDGWSAGILINELSELYRAHVQGRAAELRPLPIQYADYAVWQREWLQGEVLQRQLKYWRQQLAGLPAALDLPTDRPRPPVASFQGSRVGFSCSPELLAALVQLSRQQKATLFMTLAAAYQVLLMRWSGQRDIVIGTPIAGRRRRELEGLVGFFVNNLVLRTRVRPEESFRMLLAQVKETALGAYAHQDLPFEKLVQDLQPERDLSRQPVFQTWLLFESESNGPIDLPGVSASVIPAASDTSKFDLSLLLTETGAGIGGIFEYATDLFDRGTIERLSRHFQVLLEGIVARPDVPIGQLPLLEASEREQLLVGWNQTQHECPREKCLHELFVEQATRTPDAVALVCAEEQLTYQELDRRSNQLANHLRGLGVGAEVIVGLCMERSVEMVVGLLGILKAGGAYLPLDPEYPAERLQYMLEDARVPLVLTHSTVMDRLPSHYARMLSLDEEWVEVERQPMSAVTNVVGPFNAAYVIYTSGSTGEPKGVLVQHGGLLNLVEAQKTAFDVQQDSRVLQFARLSFDASIFEIAMALGAGATLCLLRSSAELARVLIEQRIDIVTLPPSVVASLGDSELSGLKTLVVAGESCPDELAAHWASHCHFINAYGPTETTVWASYYECKGGEHVLIGRPIWNTQLYVLDEEQEPVPVGVAGELYIGGVGLARGYLNRAGLTAQRFVPSPFGEGERLYRTGDRARYREDGNLEFLGRLDHQVKIRGHRIELGEIEAVLQRHGSVQQAAVLAREDVPGSRNLVGYVVGKGGEVPPAQVLQKYLQESLPQYMVPAVIVVLEQMPLTANGKIDRKGLPAPDQMHSAMEYVGARTPVEEALVRIWSEVLRVPRVGVHDNFFELGGHSLLATQMIARVREVLEVEIPMRDLFETATVIELAPTVDARIRGYGGETPPVCRPRQRFGKAALSFAQERLWFVEKLGLVGPTYTIPLALRLAGSLDVEGLEKSLEQLVVRHESLRTRIESVDGQGVQVIDAPGRFVLEKIELRELTAAPGQAAEESLERWVQQESSRAFEITGGVLFRGMLLQVDVEDHVLLLCMHHIISDGWSAGILIHELSELYRAHVQGRAAELRPLPIQYADYAVWQREWLQGEVLQRQLKYWRQQLAELPAALGLPTDRPRPPVASFQGSRVGFSCSPELLAALVQLSRQQKATLFMTLAAAYQVLLMRWSGQRDIVIGTPIAGRQSRELEGLVGIFLNSLVLRTRVKPEESFRMLLAQVKETALGAYAHQDLPFEKLVQELQPERDLSRQPVFQVSFALHNLPKVEMSLPGMELSLLEAGNNVSRFDLTLGVYEDAGGLKGAFEYATDLFDRGTIERLGRHFQVLLEGIVARPDVPIGQLSLLEASEREQLLVGWNQTQHEYLREKCLHELFVEQATRTPDAVALVCAEEQLTYEELDRRSNQLANYLRGLGVGAEVIVGLCMERSVEMVVGLLGILKAGGAYLPLDPEYPAERLQYMLEDARVPLVLTHSTVMDRLPSHYARMLSLDEEWVEVERQPMTAVTNVIGPFNAAYVIYTSGSTGEPKGVLVQHGGLLNLVEAQKTAFGVQHDSRVLQFARLSFDASISEIGMALGAGATLCLLRSSTELARVLIEQRIDIVTLPPSVVASLGDSELSGLKTLVVAGEPCPDELAAHWASRCHFINAYGPTETTVCASYYECKGGEHVLIGRPIWNTQLYVLDEEQEPVPVGVAGELYIGGVGLARGYLNRAGLTAQRFVPSPFGEGERLYRTGDRVRYREDGNLEFLGRLDHQVKIRGHRIELGEIEAVLQRHGSVQQAVVMAREDVPGSRNLVGYVVGKGSEVPPAEVLQKYLQESLPQYMVPAVIVVLEQMPLTANGKIDRKGLPAPDQLHSAVEYVGARTPLEEALVKIWSEVLRVPRVGVHDNFFELGGHSLLATQMIARVREVLEVEIPMRVLFQAPAVEKFAARVIAVMLEGVGQKSILSAVAEGS